MTSTILPPGSVYSLTDIRAHDVKYPGYNQALVPAYVARPAAQARRSRLLLRHTPQLSSRGGLYGLGPLPGVAVPLLKAVGRVSLPQPLWEWVGSGRIPWVPLYRFPTLSLWAFATYTVFPHSDAYAQFDCLFGEHTVRPNGRFVGPLSAFAFW